MTRAILLLISLAVLTRAQEPVRQTTEARLWLQVPAGQAPLQDIRVSAGSATPAPWEKDPAVRERLTDVIFPVRWWDWRELSLSFMPLDDGTVDLVLNGPWEQEKPGTAFRKEVLWDSISAEGTRIENGDFEEQADGKPVGWKAPYQNYPSADSWPLAKATPLQGSAVAASWQNRTLSQTLQVKAGQKVTLRLHAMAATLPDFVAPKLLGQNTPAHQALSKIKRGMNLGNCWDAPPPYSWGIRYTTEDIDRIAAQGFDHIRVPVAWSYNLKPNGDGYEVDPAILTDLEPVLRRAIEKGMRVLLDWHHFDDLTTNPEANRARFVASWEAIARHFKSWPPELFLELLNEPRDALTTELANPIYADTIAAIHKIDPRRILFVSPGKWGDIRELDKLRLPDGDDRIVVTVHCYEPFYFTHQGAPWVQLSGLRGVTYPGPPATPLALPEQFKDNAGIRDFVEGYNTLPADRNPCSAITVRELFDLARDWSVHFGRPVHLGEFGSHNLGDQASRTRYSHDVRTLAEERKIPWALWDWKAGFSYWDSKNNQPLIRAGLFD
ncbi:MAG: glycoside hydrolase family 5 protein [Luteolibacter sp.]|uniref:glycoside hydrolase family 5 protein n=1 Tax=Luteolibacter sp. TaxID=1962973 RepID=UPI0032675F12